MRGECAQGDQIVDPGRDDGELTDVHRVGAPGDVRDDDVQARTVGQHRVHEGAGQVDPATGVLEHPLDQVTHLLSGEHRGGQLAQAGTTHEDAARVVDPDLLHGRIVEIGLQRTESGHLVEHPFDRLPRVGERRQGTGERTLVVLRDRELDQTPQARRIPARVKTFPSDQLANLVGHDRDSIHRFLPRRTSPLVTEASAALVAEAYVNPDRPRAGYPQS